MKIIYCVSSVSSIGGITKITIDKANYFSVLGHDVTVVTTEDFNKDVLYAINPSVKLVSLNINYKYLYLNNLFLRSFFLLKKRREHKLLLKDIISSISPDYIIDTCGFEIPFLKKVKGDAKIIHEAHSHYYDRVISLNQRYNNIFKKIFFRIIVSISQVMKLRRLKSFDAVVVLSEAEKKLWYGIKNLYVIENFIIDSDEDFTSNCQSKKVITAGRLNKMKGLSVLVDIWKHIHDKFPEWKLEIYGDGDEYENILEQIKFNGLEESIKIYDSVSNIFKKLQSSSVFVTTSQLESFGMTIIEAQSVGLPVVAFDCPTGPRELISHGEDGFLVKLNEQDEFILHLSKLLSSYALRVEMGQAGYKNSRRFSQEKIMRKWVFLFNNI